MHSSSNQITDELLVLDWQSGDEKALQRLFERWNLRLLRCARRLTQNDDGAADVVQEAWLAMIRGIQGLDDPKTFPRWSYRIVTRRASDWIRRRQRLRRSEGTPRSSPIEGISMRGGMDVSSDSIDDADEVAFALARLPEKFRTVLVLRYLEELSIAEIAQILSKPTGTIKSRLHHAREAVRPYLTEKAVP